MAGAAVTCLLNKLRELLEPEASVPWGIRSQVNSLRLELERIQLFLEDPESNWKANHDMISVVEEIIDKAYAAEDVIDEYIMEVSRYDQEQVPPPPRPDGQTAGRKIDEFVGEICRRSDGMSIPKAGASRVAEVEHLVEVRRPCRRYDSFELIGFDQERSDIIKSLLSPISRRVVISIVGTGGLGKTALAEAIYFNRDIVSKFPVRAWVSVSQEYSVTELLQTLIHAVAPPPGEKNVESKVDARGDRAEELVKRLEGILTERNQRYLIVIDDVWNKETVNNILTVLPDVNGSRVIVTTRLSDVARSADPSITPLRLRFRDDDDSKEIMLKQWRPQEERGGVTHQFPEELNDSGCELLNMSEGLPLALVLLGGLLAVNAKDTSGANEVMEKLVRRLDQQRAIHGSDECRAVFGLCSQELPPMLKPCFLYLCSFPEYANIRATELIDLWIAEGFIPSVPDKSASTRRETAEAVLNQLIQRRLVQVTEWEHDDSVRSIRIHNLMRDFLIQEAASVGFLDVASSLVDTTTLRSSKSMRRLALQNSACCRQPRGSSWISRAKTARSLLGFNLSGACDIMNVLASFVDRAPLLRVVHVEATAPITFSVLPKEITNRIHLRHLRWNPKSANPSPLRFPASVDSLRYLETIDVAPSISGDFDGVGKLEKLETLKTIGAGRWIEDLGKLRNLRRLTVQGVDPSMWSDLLASLEKLARLEELVLQSKQEIPTKVFSIFSDNHPLRLLGLRGPLSPRQLPSSSEFPPNLKFLILEDTGLEQDPAAVLEKLPKLEGLGFGSNACTGKTFACSEDGFPRLRCLTFNSLPDKYGNLKATSMPMLTDCPTIERLPQPLLETRLQTSNGTAGREWHRHFICPPTLLPSIS